MMPKPKKPPHPAAIGIGIALVAMVVLYGEWLLAVHQGTYYPVAIVFLTAFAIFGAFLAVGSLVFPKSMNAPLKNSPEQQRKFYIMFGTLAAVGILGGVGVLRLFRSSLAERASAPTEARAPVASDGSSPAPTPDVPKPYQP